MFFFFLKKKIAQLARHKNKLIFRHLDPTCGIAFVRYQNLAKMTPELVRVCQNDRSCFCWNRMSWCSLKTQTFCPSIVSAMPSLPLFKRVLCHCIGTQFLNVNASTCFYASIPPPQQTFPSEKAPSKSYPLVLSVNNRKSSPPMRNATISQRKISQGTMGWISFFFRISRVAAIVAVPSRSIGSSSSLVFINHLRFLLMTLLAIHRGNKCHNAHLFGLHNDRSH